MGGCATKPKVLKADDRSIPAPPPVSMKEAVAASEVKEGGDVIAEKSDQKAEADVVGEDTKSKDVVEAKTVNDESNTRQSVGNLLNENEKKGVAETETGTVIEADNNTPSEPTKTEPVEQESAEEKVPAEPIESTKEPEPSSVQSEATATVDVTETEKNETSAAAATATATGAEGELGKSEVATFMFKQE